jgi:hypothetical protein
MSVAKSAQAIREAVELLDFIHAPAELGARVQGALDALSEYRVD